MSSLFLDSRESRNPLRQKVESRTVPTAVQKEAKSTLCAPVRCVHTEVHRTYTAPHARSGYPGVHLESISFSVLPRGASLGVETTGIRVAGVVGDSCHPRGPGRGSIIDPRLRSCFWRSSSWRLLEEPITLKRIDHRSAPSSVSKCGSRP